MTKHRQQQDDAVSLLDADRELTAAEQAQLKREGERGWRTLGLLLRRRARVSYSTSAQDDFAVCAWQHMDEQARTTMMAAEVYHCPACQRLLKDRNTPVATSILLERGRIRELWMDVEQAPEGELDASLDRFRRALGLK